MGLLFLTSEVSLNPKDHTLHCTHNIERLDACCHTTLGRSDFIGGRTPELYQESPGIGAAIGSTQDWYTLDVGGRLV